MSDDPEAAVCCDACGKEEDAEQIDGELRLCLVYNGLRALCYDCIPSTFDACEYCQTYMLAALVMRDGVHTFCGTCYEKVMHRATNSATAQTGNDNER